MNAANDIKERVDRFVDEILSLIRRAQDEHRARALGIVTRMLADLGRPAARASSKRLRSPRPISKLEAAQVTGKKQRARERAPRLRLARTPTERGTSAQMPPVAPIKAGTTTEPGTSASEREVVVLDTVRSLVRGTATEIATRSGLPNGSVHVVLRALVARSRVARTETARGVEYSLVSTGEIRPFKRVRAATPASPAEAERTVDATPAE